jgi:hypothetical protein
MKTAEELGITEQQRINLAKLAVGIRKLKDSDEYQGTFYMRTLCRKGNTYHPVTPSESVKAFHECGTYGCLLGHGPFLGIKADQFDSWRSYSERQFGGNWVSFDWIFDCQWPNNKRMATKRIAWMLSKGYPAHYRIDVNNRVYPRGYENFRPDWKSIEKLAQS